MNRDLEKTDLNIWKRIKRGTIIISREIPEVEDFVFFSSSKFGNRLWEVFKVKKDKVYIEGIIDQNEKNLTSN